MEIFSVLKNTRPHEDLLSQYSPSPIRPVWDSSSIDLLRRRWNDISTAQDAINGIKAAQLRLLADFKASYPDMLRWTSDIVDDRFKLNTEHMVTRFQYDARKVMRTRFLTGRLYVKYAFRHHTLPLVPYNWCLRLFVKVLERFPVNDEDPAMDFGEGASVKMNEETPEQLELEEIEKVALGEVEAACGLPNSSEKGSEPPYPYPPSISQDVLTAIAGLPWVYTLPHVSSRDTIRVARTKHTPYSAFTHNKETFDPSLEPTFITPPRVSGKARREGTRLQPHHGKEYQWLGAFLRCVEYMRGMITETEKKELERVGEREMREAERMMTEPKMLKQEKEELNKSEVREKKRPYKNKFISKPDGCIVV
jgi:hypothetical protein